MEIQIYKAVSREGFTVIDEKKYLPMFKGSQTTEAWFFVVPARNLTLLTLPEATNYINLFSIDGRQWAIAEFE